MIRFLCRSAISGGFCALLLAAENVVQYREGLMGADLSVTFVDIRYAGLWIFKDFVIALLTWLAFQLWQRAEFSGGLAALTCIFLLQEASILPTYGMDTASDFVRSIHGMPKYVGTGVLVSTVWAEIWVAGRLRLSGPLFSSCRCQVADLRRVPVASFAATRGYGTTLGVLQLLVGLPVLILHVETARWAVGSGAQYGGAFALSLDALSETVLALLSAGVMFRAWERLVTPAEGPSNEAATMQLPNSSPGAIAGSCRSPRPS